MNFASLFRDARIKNFRAVPEKRAYYITTQMPIQAPKTLQKYGFTQTKLMVYLLARFAVLGERYT
jgi:hypothetical protein